MKILQRTFDLELNSVPKTKIEVRKFINIKCLFCSKNLIRILENFNFEICCILFCQFMNLNPCSAKSPLIPSCIKCFLSYGWQGRWVHLCGPVKQANGRLIFEDDLRSGGLLCFILINASVRADLDDSIVTLGNPEMTSLVYFICVCYQEPPDP